MSTATAAPELVPTPRDPTGHGRTRWLDGVRFAAAMFVVLHHCWLTYYPEYPRNAGPSWLGWMLYGHLAVVVFIVVSGYSLTLAPAKRGFNLQGGWRTFAKRRAWRIVPPYWAALILSMPVFAFIESPGVGAGTVAKSFVVHGLLLQDIIGSPSPNGAFWSIAVEAQIYILFPLMLYIRRRRGPLFTTGLVILVTCALELIAHRVHPLARYDNLTPQLLVDFACGMAAADSMNAVRLKGRRVPMLGLSGLLCVGTVVAMNVIGSQEIVKEYFWVDIVVGIITAMAFRGIASCDRSLVKSFFQSRLMVAGGRFSYSIYLIHALVIVIVWRYIVSPLHWTDLRSLGLQLTICLPVVLCVSYGFFVIFERPFLNTRSMAAIRPMLARLGIGRRESEVASAPPVSDEPLAKLPTG